MQQRENLDQKQLQRSSSPVFIDSSLRATQLHHCVLPRCLQLENSTSVPKTAYLLLSEPVYSSTCTFVCVSLDGSCQICDQSADHTSTKPVTSPSTIKVYGNQLQYAAQFPGIAQLDLFDFVKSTVQSTMTYASHCTYIPKIFSNPPWAVVRSLLQVSAHQVQTVV